MTKAPNTAQGKAPLRRLVTSRFDGPLVAELTDGELTLRPPKCRRGGRAAVSATWGQLYDALLLQRAADEARAKRRAKRKGGRK